MTRGILLLLCCCGIVSAEDLGLFGETFEIIEPDLLEHITLQLQALRNSGRLDAERAKVEERIKTRILHPVSVARVAHTTQKREFYFDPTITVTRDLIDHNGRVFARKGQRFNPLEQMAWSKTLLFIDGEDSAHIQWAISKIQQHNYCKIILVNGSPIDLQEQLHRDIYFDQHGLLTAKLNIQYVPAIVFQRQDAHVLTIIEEPTDAS